MGRPAESLIAHDLAFNESVSNFDKSAILQMKADSYLLLNQVDAAIECYNNALEYTYYELKLYLPLVECHREKGIFTKDDWANMLKKMEHSLALSKKDNYMTDEAKADTGKSFLYRSTTNYLYYDSAIYRALFAAADKGVVNIHICTIFIMLSFFINFKSIIFLPFYFNCLIHSLFHLVLHYLYYSW